MRDSVKAALLSGLVFPGSGHLLLKKTIPGVLLMGVAAICVYILFSASLEVAQQISDGIQRGEIPLDADRISAAIAKQMDGSQSQRIQVSTSVLVVCWLVGIVDAFRVGFLRDKARQADLNRPQ
ncbi:MAG: hypothetical protein H6999_00720 [Hahellaceae bacterium]|nr:hypothetical protein [Hahellaceae bacterium]MCP5168273.1 hypothetical protein [Hahellaceae bacterium]